MAVNPIFGANTVLTRIDEVPPFSGNFVVAEDISSQVIAAGYDGGLQATEQGFGLIPPVSSDSGLVNSGGLVVIPSNAFRTAFTPMGERLQLSANQTDFQFLLLIACDSVDVANAVLDPLTGSTMVGFITDLVNDYPLSNFNPAGTQTQNGILYAIYSCQLDGPALLSYIAEQNLTGAISGVKLTYSVIIDGTTYNVINKSGTYQNPANLGTSTGPAYLLPQNASQAYLQGAIAIITRNVTVLDIDDFQGFLPIQVGSFPISFNVGVAEIFENGVLYATGDIVSPIITSILPQYPNFAGATGLDFTLQNFSAPPQLNTFYELRIPVTDLFFNTYVISCLLYVI